MLKIKFENSDSVNVSRFLETGILVCNEHGHNTKIKKYWPMFSDEHFRVTDFDSYEKFQGKILLVTINKTFSIAELFSTGSISSFQTCVRKLFTLSNNQDIHMPPIWEDIENINNYQAWYNVLDIGTELKYTGALILHNQKI